jgi:hypothetical protein
MPEPADVNDELINSIHEQFVKKSNSFHSVIKDSIGSRFAESFLLCCKTDLLVEHYLNAHLLPNLVDYAKHIYANYSIQTLVKHRVAYEPKA